MMLSALITSFSRHSQPAAHQFPLTEKINRMECFYTDKGQNVIHTPTFKNVYLIQRALLFNNKSLNKPKKNINHDIHFSFYCIFVWFSQKRFSNIVVW
jgi:hypothetical protein